MANQRNRRRRVKIIKVVFAKKPWNGDFFSRSSDINPEMPYGAGEKPRRGIFQLTELPGCPTFAYVFPKDRVHDFGLQFLSDASEQKNK